MNIGEVYNFFARRYVALSGKTAPYARYMLAISVCFGVILMAVHIILFMLYMLLVIYVFSNKERTSLLHWVLAVVCLTAVFYGLFYLFSPVIWSKNIQVDPNKLALHLRSWYLKPRDGIEALIIYASILAFIAVLACGIRMNLVPQNINKVLAIPLILVVVIFLAYIGLYPPNAFNGEDDLHIPRHIFIGVNAHSILITTTASFFLMVLVFLYKNKPFMTFFLIAIALVPICFIATRPISTFDYAHIFFGALKILKNMPVAEIYFQYDLLLSIIAIPFVHFELDPNYIHLVFQASLFVLFVGLMVLASKYFMNQILVIPFILSVVVLRIYAGYFDPSYSFQVTPLRLDLWIIPLFLSIRFGLFHWSVGFSLGSLAVLHANFGLIYILSYVQAVSLVFVMGLILAIKSKKQKGIYATSILHLKQVLQKYGKALGFIVVGLGLKSLIFNRVGLNRTAEIYQDFGISFARVGAHSFYWVIFAFILFSMALILIMQPSVSKRYFSNAVFIILLTVGNSLYFLGRSHESNLIWVSGSVILLLYTCLDLLILRYHNEPNHLKRAFVNSFPFIACIAVCFLYVENAKSVTHKQIDAVNSGKIINLPPSDYKIEAIKKYVGENDKVFVMSRYDFYIYYYGNYTPTAYFTPYNTWLYKDDLIMYLQTLLDDGYTIVCDHCEEEILDELRYNPNIHRDGPYSMYRNY